MRTLLILMATTMIAGAVDIVILFSKVDKTQGRGVDGAKNHQNTYDIVDIYRPIQIPSDGNYASDPDYYYIRVNDVPGNFAEVKDRLLKPRYAGGDPGPTNIGPAKLEYRKYFVRAADMPAGLRGRLFLDGYRELTWAQIAPYLRDKHTGLDEG